LVLVAAVLAVTPVCGSDVRATLPRTNLDTSSTSLASDLRRRSTPGDAPSDAGALVLRRGAGELNSPLLGVDVRRCGERVAERRGADMRSANARCSRSRDSRLDAAVDAAAS